MKTSLLISLFLLSQIMTAQTVVTNSDVEEHSLFYSDTANNEFSYGGYFPKDIVKLDDGSILIGTELSISFPSRYASTETYDSTYLAEAETFNRKTHSSSGTLIKLNENLEKEWEVIFRGKRVKRVLKTSDNRIFLAGEHVSMKLVWLAEINHQGRILWEKRYQYKRNVTLATVALDNFNNFYFLLEASKVIPFKFSKNTVKKLHFFKIAENNTHLALLKVSKEGRKIWRRTLNSNKHISKYGQNIVVSDSSVFISYQYSGIISNSAITGYRLVEVAPNGRVKQFQETPKQEVVFFAGGPITLTKYAEEKVFLFKSQVKIDSICIPSLRNSIGIHRTIKNSTGYLALGTILDKHQNYLCIKISQELKFEHYWKYPSENFYESVGAVELDDGALLILGYCYKEATPINKRLTRYINLMKVKGVANN